MLNDLIIKEDYKIFDKLANQMNNKNVHGPLGWVRIYLQTKKGIIFDEGPNLITAQGREYVAQRLFSTNLHTGGSRPNWTNYILSHFAVGSGGSIVSGSPPIVTLQGPYICDTSLVTPISLGISGYLTEPNGTQLSVKPITDNGSRFLESNSYGGGGNTCVNFTKMKCICVISDNEPSSLPTGQSIKIDEAGIYFVSGSTALLFSHICFAPKWKEKESVLSIHWYILF